MNSNDHGKSNRGPGEHGRVSWLSCHSCAYLLQRTCWVNQLVVLPRSSVYEGEIEKSLGPPCTSALHAPVGIRCVGPGTEVFRNTDSGTLSMSCICPGALPLT